MEITVSGRHFNVTEQIKQKVIDALTAEFAELPLKVISATAVLDVQGNRAIAEIVVNIKNLTAKAQVEDFDLYKAIDAACAKVDIQMTKVLDKVQDHQAQPLREVEPKE